MAPLLYFLLVAAAAGLAVWIYLREEPAVRGRNVLTALRVTAFLLIGLLLWNPSLSVSSDAPGVSWVVVDGTLGMTALDEGGESAWDRALEEARERLSEAPVGRTPRLVVYDGELHMLDLDSLESFSPHRPGSEMHTALLRAAEAGAQEMTVLSDFRLRTGGSFRRLLTELPTPTRLQDVSGSPRNAGIVDFRLPSSLSTGEDVEAEVEVFGEGGGEGDSAVVEVLEEGTEVGRASVSVPGPGERLTAAVPLSAPSESGWTRYEARVQLEGDGFPWDDSAILYRDVDREARGVVLLSLLPDWEPRFLLPVLRNATGLDGVGLLHTTDGRYLPLVEGGADVAPWSEEEAREAVEEAELLVLHGISGEAPPWVQEAAADVGRLLLFPADAEGAAQGGLQVGSGADGEWYLDPEVPASPVAPYLGELIPGTETIPPLHDIWTLDEVPTGAAFPLLIRRDRRGEALPALALHPVDGRRVAVALASGYWRWAMRPGTSRDAYRRSWSGTAAWLMAGERRLTGLEVRPEEFVASEGETIRWRAPGWTGETLTLRIRPADEEEWEDGEVEVDEMSGFDLSAPSPGLYLYEAYGGAEADSVVGEGRFDVVRRSLELMHPPRAPEELLAASDTDVPETGLSDLGRVEEPLRTHPLPWILLVAVLCVEWIGRRRVGLR